MNFTGKNLDIVREALYDAIANCKNEIGQVPNIYEHADHIEQCEQDIERYEKLIRRIEAKQGK